jgi:hypothetical protein
MKGRMESDADLLSRASARLNRSNPGGGPEFVSTSGPIFMDRATRVVRNRLWIEQTIHASLRSTMQQVVGPNDHSRSIDYEDPGAHSGEFGTGFRSKPAGASTANRQVIPLQTGMASRSNPAGFPRADGYATELAPANWEILA